MLRLNTSIINRQCTTRARAGAFLGRWWDKSRFGASLVSTRELRGHPLCGLPHFPILKANSCEERQSGPSPVSTSSPHGVQVSKLWLSYHIPSGTRSTSICSGNDNSSCTRRASRMRTACKACMVCRRTRDGMIAPNGPLSSAHLLPAPEVPNPKDLLRCLSELMLRQRRKTSLRVLAGRNRCRKRVPPWPSKRGRRL